MKVPGSHFADASLRTGVALDEEEGLEEAAPPVADDELGESDDEMAGFIDDNDFGRKKGRSRANKTSKQFSSHGLQVPFKQTVLLQLTLRPDVLQTSILLFKQKQPSCPNRRTVQHHP